MEPAPHNGVMPAKAGTQVTYPFGCASWLAGRARGAALHFGTHAGYEVYWVPAFAGMTPVEGLAQVAPLRAKE